MKFCSKCGAQLNDTDKFCQNCGTPVPDAFSQSAAYGAQPGAGGQQTYQPGQQMYQPGQQAYQPEQQMYQPGQQAYQPGQQTYQPGQQTYQSYGQQVQAKPKKKFPFPIVIGAAALIIIAVCLIVIFTGSGSLTMNGAVKSYYKALQKESGKAYIEATCSPSMIKALEKELGISKSKLIKKMDSGMSYLVDEGVKYRNFEITDKEKYDKDEIKEGIDDIKDETGVRVKISQMYDITVEFEMWDPDYEEWDSDEEDLTVYKSGGKWFVMPEL